MENIAKIKLAPGRVGFYDPLSRIHLTLGSPYAYVKSGTNCSALRRNVRNGLITIEEGTLGENVLPFKVITTDNGGFRLVSNAEEDNKPVVKAPPSVQPPNHAPAKAAALEVEEEESSTETEEVATQEGKKKKKK